MSSVSAACIFDAYSASSAHTDTFYIVSQIVRVRNSKRHFFSKLTFPYIIQPLCFTLRPHQPQPPRFTLRQHRPQPPRFTLRQHRPQPFRFTLRQHRPQTLRLTLRQHRPQPLRFTLRQHRPQTLRFTLRQHRPQPLRFTLRPHRPQPLRLTLRQHRPQPLRFTLRQHRPQPPCLHSTATSTTARHFAQQSHLNSSADNFSYFFKKALDKYPKTVYNVYCYLGVAQIGSALPWGGRGRRFKSCHSDQLKTA